jgi:hypothetical protein
MDDQSFQQEKDVEKTFFSSRKVKYFIFRFKEIKLLKK